MSENEEAWNQWCATTDLEFSDPSEQREGFDAGWDAHKALTPQPTGDVAELIAQHQDEADGYISVGDTGNAEFHADTVAALSELESTRQQLADAEVVIADIQHLWRTQKPEVFHVRTRQVIAAYKPTTTTKEA